MDCYYCNYYCHHHLSPPTYLLPTTTAKPTLRPTTTCGRLHCGGGLCAYKEEKRPARLSLRSECELLNTLSNYPPMRSLFSHSVIAVARRAIGAAAVDITVATNSNSSSTASTATTTTTTKRRPATVWTLSRRRLSGRPIERGANIPLEIAPIQGIYTCIQVFLGQPFLMILCCGP